MAEVAGSNSAEPISISSFFVVLTSRSSLFDKRADLSLLISDSTAENTLARRSLSDVQIYDR